MQVARGFPVIASLPVVGPPPRMGARIETPITRAIQSAWQPATLNVDGDEWTVALEAPVAAGEYLIVWMDDLGGGEVFVPLWVT